MTQLEAGTISGTSASRREFLHASLTIGGALVFGFHFPLASATAGTQKQAPFAPNAFIRIDRKGAVTFIIPQAEMGQGVYTSIGMILAEELDVAWERVQVEPAPPSDKLYGNPTFGLQVTGNSNSIRAFWTPLRKAGAGARDAGGGCRAPLER
jgi:isoquinoline 1-oxidoreductase beta subunit